MRKQIIAKNNIIKKQINVIIRLKQQIQIYKTTLYNAGKSNHTARPASSQKSLDQSTFSREIVYQKISPKSKKRGVSSGNFTLMKKQPKYKDDQLRIRSSKQKYRDVLTKTKIKRPSTGTNLRKSKNKNLVDDFISNPSIQFQEANLTNLQVLTFQKSDKQNATPIMVLQTEQEFDSQQQKHQRDSTEYLVQEDRINSKKVERTTPTLNKKDEQIFKLNSYLKQYIQLLHQAKQELQKQEEIYNGQLAKLKQFVQQSQEKQKKKLDHSDNEISQLKEQIKNLNLLLQQKIFENKQYKYTCGEQLNTIENLSQQVINFEEDFKKFKQFETNENAELRSNAQKYFDQQKEFKILQKENEELKKQIQKGVEDIKINKKTSDNLQQNIEIMNQVLKKYYDQQDIESEASLILNKQINDKKEQAIQLQEKIESLQEEITQMKVDTATETQKLISTNDNLKKQMKKTKKESKEKEKEVCDCNEQFNKIKLKLVETNEAHKRQLQEYEQQIQLQIQQRNRFEAKTQREHNELSSIIKLLKEDVEDKEKQLKHYENLNELFLQSEGRNEQMGISNETLKEEIQELEIKLQDQIDETAMQKRKFTNKQAKLITTAKFDKKTMQEQDAKIKELQDKYKASQETCEEQHVQLSSENEKLQNQIQEVQQENERQRQELTEENSYIRLKLEQIESDKKSQDNLLELEIKNHKIFTKGLEDKIMELTTENDKNQDLLTENSQMKKRLQEQQTRIHAELAKAIRLKEKINILKGRLSEQNSKLELSEMTFTQENKHIKELLEDENFNLRSQVSDTQKQLQKLLLERETGVIQMEEVNKNLQNALNQLSKKDRQILERNEKNKKIQEDLELQQQRLAGDLAKQDKSLEIESGNVQQIIKQIQGKIQVLTTDNEQQKGDKVELSPQEQDSPMKEKLVNENQDLKKQLLELEVKMLSLNQDTSEMQNDCDTIAKLLKQIEEKKENIQVLEAQNQSLTKQLEVVTQQFEEVTQKCEKYKKEIDLLETMNTDNRKEVENLEKANKSNEDKIQELTKEYKQVLQNLGTEKCNHQILNFTIQELQEENIKHEKQNVRLVCFLLLTFLQEQIEFLKTNLQKKEEKIKQIYKWLKEEKHANQELGESLQKLIENNKKLQAQDKQKDNRDQEKDQQIGDELLNPDQDMEEAGTKIQKSDEAKKANQEVTKDKAPEKETYNRDQEKDQEIGQEFLNPDKDMEDAAVKIQTFSKGKSTTREEVKEEKAQEKSQEKSQNRDQKKDQEIGKEFLNPDQDMEDAEIKIQKFDTTKKANSNETKENVQEKPQEEQLKEPEQQKEIQQKPKEKDQEISKVQTSQQEIKQQEKEGEIDNKDDQKNDSKIQDTSYDTQKDMERQVAAYKIQEYYRDKKELEKDEREEQEELERIKQKSMKKLEGFDKEIEEAQQNILKKEKSIEQQRREINLLTKQLVQSESFDEDQYEDKTSEQHSDFQASQASGDFLLQLQGLTSGLQLLENALEENLGQTGQTEEQFPSQKESELPSQEDISI